MIRCLVLFTLALVLPFVSTAQDDHAAWLRAAQTAYDSGDYAEAARLYQALVDAGNIDAGLFYNLGSAYYQSEEIGWALLYFRRAQQLDPRDAATNRAIARIRAERVDFQGEERTLIDGLATTTARLVTMGELRWIVLAVWGIWFALMGWWSRCRLRWLRYAVIVSGMVLLLGGGLLVNRMYVEVERPAAVVVAGSVQVMSGPGDEYLPLFRLFTAAELRWIEERYGWVRFLLPDGRQGWIPVEAAARVNSAQQVG